MPRFAQLESNEERPWEPLEYSVIQNIPLSLSEYIADFSAAEVCPEDEIPEIYDRNDGIVIRIEGEECEVFGEKRIDYYYDLYWEA